MKDRALFPERALKDKCPKCKTNPYSLKHSSGYCNECWKAYQKERYRIRMMDASTKGTKGSMEKYKSYEQNAKVKQREFNLTYDDYLLIVEYPCVYCGTTDEQRGMDRLDSNLGYIFENVVSCCKVCNYAKRNMTHEKFEAWISKLINYRLSF